MLVKQWHIQWHHTFQEGDFAFLDSTLTALGYGLHIM